ncbi:hypothetical protein, conserved [Plasmodium gonderi]|uniref:Mon2/Sec7/BIG1-like dimerisation and cyclophilin-binding domain-containing protein n=1 Tax=Plasmodium gonderi TaxID=77519 RepID=A0A1Y1JJC3_PLAGO|nr:hypothetical protein, conserved [Plasmodium gonderi]GAW82561.1 hypothetical protein, conserved [Plasmodium gonderi]
MDHLPLLEELKNDMQLLIVETKKRNVCIKEKTEICIIKIKNYNSIIKSNKNQLLSNFEFPMDEIIDIINIGVHVNSHKISSICLLIIQRVVFYILYLIDNKDVIQNFKYINVEKQIEKITNKLFDLTFVEDKKVLIKIVQIILTAFSPQYIEYCDKNIINTLLKILYSVYYSSLYDNNTILYQTCCAAYKQLLNSLIDVCNKESIINSTVCSSTKISNYKLEKNEKNKTNQNCHIGNNDYNHADEDHSSEVQHLYFENFDLQYDTNSPIDLIYITDVKDQSYMQNKNKLLSLIHYLCYCCFVNIRLKYSTDDVYVSYTCGNTREEKQKGKRYHNNNPDHVKAHIKSETYREEKRKDYFNNSVNVISERRNNSNIFQSSEPIIETSSTSTRKNHDKMNRHNSSRSSSNNIAHFEQNNDKTSTHTLDPSYSENTRHMDKTNSDVTVEEKINAYEEQSYKKRNSTKNENLYTYTVKNYNIKKFLKILKSTNPKNQTDNMNNYESNENINADSCDKKTDILSNYNKNNLILPLNFCLDLLYIFLNNYEFFLQNFEFFKLLKFEIVYIILISLKYNLHTDVFYRCLKIFKIICHKYFQYFLGEIKFLFLILIEYLCLTQPFSKLFIVLNFFFYLFDNTLTLFHLYKYFCYGKGCKIKSPFSPSGLGSHGRMNSVKEPELMKKDVEKEQELTKKDAEKEPDMMKKCVEKEPDVDNSLVNSPVMDASMTKDTDGSKKKKKKKKKTKRHNILEDENGAILEQNCPIEKSISDKESNLGSNKFDAASQKNKARDDIINEIDTINYEEAYDVEKILNKDKINHWGVEPLQKRNCGQNEDGKQKEEKKKKKKGRKNLKAQRECHSDDNNLVFIKIVEYISKIIHELLFLHSIDITKMYIHLKVFKYDRIYVGEKKNDQIIGKGRSKYSTTIVLGERKGEHQRDPEEEKGHDKDKIKYAGKNQYETIETKKQNYIEHKHGEKVQVNEIEMTKGRKKEEEHIMQFRNFFCYPIILPNNCINPRENFYLFKYSAEKKVNKIVFDELCYKDTDEIRLLASAVDNILSLVNSFYVIFLNILKMSLNQYCFATIDLNDENVLLLEHSFPYHRSSFENGNAREAFMAPYYSNEQGCDPQSIQSSRHTCSNNGDHANFDYELERRIEYYNNNSFHGNTNCEKKSSNNAYSTVHNNIQSNVNSYNTLFNPGECVHKHEKSEKRRDHNHNDADKNNCYDDSISIFCKVFNSTCRYFISSLCLIFSYTNTLDSCFFSGFQKLIFISTHLKINICTDACLQTLTKCSSIFTLENSPFFLKILRNFEKQENKYENNSSSKKNKTGIKTMHKDPAVYSTCESKTSYFKRKEINSNDSNIGSMMDAQNDAINTIHNIRKSSKLESNVIIQTKNIEDLNKCNIKDRTIPIQWSSESDDNLEETSVNEDIINHERIVNIQNKQNMDEPDYTDSGNALKTEKIVLHSENNFYTIENGINIKGNVINMYNRSNTNINGESYNKNYTYNDIYDVAKNVFAVDEYSYKSKQNSKTNDTENQFMDVLLSKRTSIESAESNFVCYKSTLNEDLLKYFDKIIGIILKESYYINNDLNNIKYILSIKAVISIFFIYGDNLHFDNWLKMINLLVEINYIYKYISSIENKTIEFLNFLHYINKNEEDFIFSLSKSLIDTDKNTYIQNVNSKSVEFCYFILRFIQKNPVLCAEITIIFSSFPYFFKNTTFYNISTLINILNSIHFMIFNQFFKQKELRSKIPSSMLCHKNKGSTDYYICPVLHEGKNKSLRGKNGTRDGKTLDITDGVNEGSYGILKNSKDIHPVPLNIHMSNNTTNNNDNGNNVNIRTAGLGTAPLDSSMYISNSDEREKKELCNTSNIHQNMKFNKLNRKKNVIEKYVEFLQNNDNIFEIFYYYLSHFDPMYTSYFCFYSNLFFLTKEAKMNWVCNEEADDKDIMEKQPNRKSIKEKCINYQKENLLSYEKSWTEKTNYKYYNSVTNECNYFIVFKKLEKFCIFEDFYPLHMIEMLCIININKITDIYNNCCMNILLLSLCKNNDIQKKSIDTLFNIIKESVIYYKYNFEIQFLLFKPFFFFIVNPYVSYRSYFITSFLNFIRKNASFFNRNMWLFIIFLLYVSFQKELKRKTLKNISEEGENQQIMEENISNINNIFNILEIIIVDYIEEIPVCKIMEIIIHMLILFSSLSILGNNISFRAINFSWSIVDYIVGCSHLLKEHTKTKKSESDHGSINDKEKFNSNLNSTGQDKKCQHKNDMNKGGNNKLLLTCFIENKKMYIYQKEIKMKNIKMKSFFIFILNHLMKLCFDERIEVRNCSIKTIISILSTHICKFDFFFYKTSICLLLKRLSIKYYCKLLEYFKIECKNENLAKDEEQDENRSDKSPPMIIINNLGERQTRNEMEDYTINNHTKVEKTDPMNDLRNDPENYLKNDDTNMDAQFFNHTGESKMHGRVITGKDEKEKGEVSRSLLKSEENDITHGSKQLQMQDKVENEKMTLRMQFRNSFSNLTEDLEEHVIKKKIKKREKKNAKHLNLLQEIEKIMMIPNSNSNNNGNAASLEPEKNCDLYDYVNENFSKIIIHHSRDSKLKQWIETFILIIEGCNRILLEQKNYRKVYAFYDMFVNILKTILFMGYKNKNMFELHISILQILNNIFMSQFTYYDVCYFTMKNSLINRNRCTDINLFDMCLFYIYNYAYSTDDPKIKDSILKLTLENLKNIHCYKWTYVHTLMYFHLFHLLFTTIVESLPCPGEKKTYFFLNHDSILNKLFFDYFIRTQDEVITNHLDVSKCKNSSVQDGSSVASGIKNELQEETKKELQEETKNELQEETKKELQEETKNEFQKETKNVQDLNTEKDLSFINRHFTFEYQRNQVSDDPLNIYNILENNKNVYISERHGVSLNLKNKNIYEIYLNGNNNSEIFTIMMDIFQTLECDKINILINDELLKCVKYLQLNLSGSEMNKSIFTKLVHFLFNDQILFNENSDEIIEKIELNDTYNKLEMEINIKELNEENKECSRLFTLNYKKIYPLNNYIEYFQTFSIGLFNYFIPFLIYYIHNKFNLYPNYNTNVVFSIILCNFIRNEYYSIFSQNENYSLLLSFVNMFPYIIASHVKCFLHNINNNSCFVFYESIIILLKITYNMLQKSGNMSKENLLKYWYAIIFSVEKILFVNCNNDKIDMLDIMLIKFIRNHYLIENSKAPLFIKIYLTKIISELNDKKRRAFSSWTLQILFEEYEKMTKENYNDNYYTTFITLIMLKKCVLTLRNFSSENNENADEVLFILDEMKKLKCNYSYICTNSSSTLKCLEDKAHLFICYPYLLNCLNTENTKVFTSVKESLKLISYPLCFNSFSNKEENIE